MPVRGGVVALSVLTALGLTKLAITGACAAGGGPAGVPAATAAGCPAADACRRGWASARQVEACKRMRFYLAGGGARRHPLLPWTRPRRRAAAGPGIGGAIKELWKKKA